MQVLEVRMNMERTETGLLNRILFVGGPPRSGTSFAVKSLNSHPRIVAAVDDHVFECWGLYRYRDRSGLVQDLRMGHLDSDESKRRLKAHLFKDHRIQGAASSPKTAGFPEIPPSSAGLSDSLGSALDSTLVRHSFPMDDFPANGFLCLKSPEISFVLPLLSAHFRQSKFVLVYRPMVEIAESMFRLGNIVMRFPVYHRRWRDEKTENEVWMTPPGIPGEWIDIWQSASDFQRCAIYAAAYMKALVDGLRDLPAHRYFVYNHIEMKNRPAEVFRRVGGFLGVEAEGFGAACGSLESFSRPVPTGLKKEFMKIERKLDAEKWESSLAVLARRA